MKARLALYIGEELAWGEPIGARGTTIGREDDNAIRLEDTKVSRHHAAVRPRDGKWFIEDLGSTNGVYVNGAKIEQAELRKGDQVHIGSYDLVFEVAQDGEAWPAAGRGRGASQRRRATLTEHREDLTEWLQAPTEMPRGPETMPSKDEPKEKL